LNFGVGFIKAKMRFKLVELHVNQVTTTNQVSLPGKCVTGPINLLKFKSKRKLGTEPNNVEHA